METQTTRFGPVEIDPDDSILFPTGLLAFEQCRHWVLLADADNDAVAWMQSVVHPEVAMAVVSPRRFVPEYRLRVTADQLAPLEFTEIHQAYLLAVVSKHESSLTINLKAPLVINLQRRLGRQVVATGEAPVQHALPGAARLRKSA